MVYHQPTYVGMFNFYFRKVHREYADNMDDLLEYHTRVWAASISDTVFAPAPLKLGPEVVSYEHTC